MITVVNKKNHIATPDDYYVGRGSPLGNPVAVAGKSCHTQVSRHVGTREEAIRAYEEHLNQAVLSGDPDICHALNELIIRKFRGQDTNLVCFCDPLDCHGRIIKEKIESSKYCINWFSNMRRMDAPIVHQGIYYWTVENFYQAMKIPKDNLAERQRFAQMNPFQSKTQIRKIKDLNPEWNDQFKVDVMTFAVGKKFAKGTSWHKKLMAFRHPIIETNNWKDTFWGVDIFTNKGDNVLGNIVTALQHE